MDHALMNEKMIRPGIQLQEFAGISKYLSQAQNTSLSIRGFFYDFNLI